MCSFVLVQYIKRVLVASAPRFLIILLGGVIQMERLGNQIDRIDL